MAGYRRFVAYVYEYQKEKKGSNCGFIKVEVRGEICRIELHLQCSGLIAGAECKVYGFVRNRGLLDGILLGSCMTEEGTVRGLLETSAEHMGDSDKSLDEMNGMIFVTEQGGFFGTEWDDQMIRPGDFRVVEKRIPEEEKIHKDDREQRAVHADNKNPEKDTEQGAEAPIVSETENTPAEIPETDEAKMAAEKSTEQQEAQELHTQSVQESEISEQILTESDGNLTAQKTPDQNLENMLHEPEKPGMPRPLPGTPCDVFPDGELSDCRKISPQDLCRFGRRACMLRNNRFVQYGSYNFGHLLLCRNRCGQMILGVPGGYDQQERFMASMFGFPYFKESRHIQIPGGKGGYWYRLIDTPDANHGNGRL